MAMMTDAQFWEGKPHGIEHSQESLKVTLENSSKFRARLDV
jgi:hypothetical protein